MSDNAPSSGDEKERLAREADERLIRGEITLGQFLGMTREHLFKWAETGYNLMQAGSTQQALSIFQGLVAVAPYESVFHCQLAAAHMTLQQFDEAFAEFQQALRFNSSSVDALVGRGELQLRRGNVPAGLDDFTQAVKHDPELKRRSTQRARAILSVLQQQAEQAQKNEVK